MDGYPSVCTVNSAFSVMRCSYLCKPMYINACACGIVSHVQKNY